MILIVDGTALEMVTVKQAAAISRLSYKELATLRHSRVGPPWVSVHPGGRGMMRCYPVRGWRVLYERAPLVAWCHNGGPYAVVYGGG